MALPSGTRLGHYEISELLGSGGMGEVYRARDLRLPRQVALKLLPPSYADHPDYVARFAREARVLAAISHPNVAAIYGVEEAEGTRALVLELVEGSTLAELIAVAESGTGLPLAQTLDIAAQIALALEAVHERGIVHRDLKPANIKVAPGGTVKVLDFGLGRAVEAADTASAATTAITTAGAVMGTAAYMSPEQARGDAVDKRADIWAFGCILFEMLAGRRAFEGKSWPDTIGQVIGAEPDWTRLPLHTPAALRRLLRRCLTKDARQRLRDIGDARLDIEDARGTDDRGPAARRVQALHGDVRVERLTDAIGTAGAPALSPDGKMIAFVAVAHGRRHVWIRMAAGGTPLQITRGDGDHDAPRWLPDASGLIYYSAAPQAASGFLWQIPALGGTPRRLVAAVGGADVSGDGRRLAFLQAVDGDIALTIAGLDGSAPQPVAILPPAYHYDCPRWAPGDREISFQHAGALFAGQLEVIRIQDGSRRTLARASWLRGHAWLPDGSGIVYSSSAGSTLAYPPTNNLRVVDAAGGTDRQLTFGDVSYFEPDLRGDGRLLASRVRSRSDLWWFPIDGTPAANVRNAVRVTHQTGQIQAPAVSPDGRRIAYVSDSGGHSNLWLADADGGNTEQLTFERDPAITIAVPCWTPDGERILFVGGRDGRLDVCAISRHGGDTTEIVRKAFAPSCSADGRWLYFTRPSVRLEKLELATGTIVPVREHATSPAISPDSRTLYFTGTESGLDGHSQICRATPDDGPAEVLVRIAARRVPLAPRLWIHPSLSPDGRWLAAPLLDSITANLWTISTEDGAMRAVTDFGDRAVFIARWVSWSADGQRLCAAVADIDADVVLFDGLI